MVLRISVLGSFQVSGSSNIRCKFKSNKARALLAYLVIERNRPHSREQLTELLWPEKPPQSAFGNLRYALAHLRKVIGDADAQPHYLLISHESLQFNSLSNYELDVAVFTHLLQIDDIEILKQAVTLYQGDFLAGFPSINSNPFEEWIILKREQFRRQAIDALHFISSHYEQTGAYQQALPYAHRQVELEPWLEEAHQQFIRALALDGQRSAALAQYETCRRVLANELNVEPSRETIQLYETIRDGGLGIPQSVSSDEYEKVMRSLVYETEGLGVTVGMIRDTLSEGGQAAKRFGYEEAVTHYRHGLNLLSSLVDSPEKLELELQFQIALGVSFLSIRNFSDPEVVQAYRRAYEICRTMGDRSGLFHALKALSSYYALCGDVHAGLDIGQRLMKIAEDSQDDTQLVIANNNRGISLLFAGELIAYQHHAQKVLDLYDKDRHRHLAAVMGYDPKVSILSQSIGLWALGYPDQAIANVRRAVEWSKKIQHPFSQCYAQFFLAYVHLFRREASAVLEHAETLISLSKQICNSFWLGQGLIVKGWAMAQVGQPAPGLQLLFQGFSIIRGTGSIFVLCSCAAWLCEVCGLAGKAEEGLSMLEKYISQSSSSGNLHMMSANYQCQGELQLKVNQPEEAEVSFEKAIEIARRQSAKGWELRATLSLSRLWMHQGKADAAYHRLREIYVWFGEGLDTADLIEAKTLLGELSNQPAD
jgi:DNA-binding SARP family transcriptional activator